MDMNKRLLVVDDDEAIRKLFVAKVRRTGFEAAEAENGRKALDLIEAGQTFHGIITDNTMPYMTGQEFIERLRSMSEYQQVPIVMVSTDLYSHINPQSLEIFCKKHRVEFLPKPCRTEELMAVIVPLIMVE